MVGDGFVVEVDTGYRNLTVDQCQAVCANVSVCAVTWLHCCPSHCVLMSSCSGTSGWDDSHWSDRLGLSYESRAVSAYASVRSGESPGLVTWVKADGAWMDGACRDPQYGSGSDDVGPEEMRLMLRSACPSEYGACVGDASCSAELSVGLVSDAAMLADAASELFESLTGATHCRVDVGCSRWDACHCLMLILVRWVGASGTACHVVLTVRSFRAILRRVGLAASIRLVLTVAWIASLASTRLLLAVRR